MPSTSPSHLPEPDDDPFGGSIPATIAASVVGAPPADAVDESEKETVFHSDERNPFQNREYKKDEPIVHEECANVQVSGTINDVPPQDITKEQTQLEQIVEELQAGLAREREERRQEQIVTDRRIAALQDELRWITQRLFREPETFTQIAASSPPGGLAPAPVQLGRTFEERLDEHEEKLSGKSVALSPIREDLADEVQRAVLQAIADLPDDAFADAERLIATLEGQPMTRGFCESFRQVLFARGWGVVCTTCGKPSGIVWNSNQRYREGGRAHFSHSAPSPHGSITTILKFHLAQKVYRKKR